MDVSSSLLNGYFIQPTRRSYSKSFKAQVIQECARPGVSIASIELSHSLNANLVHRWIRVQAQKRTVLQPSFISLPMPLASASFPLSPQVPVQRYRGS
ncbi:transposase [Pseudomonas amygdali]|uniref:transposase n=1 Tax=Pseudomonas amygdali TaxID=47877 RepID=UPI001FB67222|nr:transposase [Pseudomonas amygdali]